MFKQLLLLALGRRPALSRVPDDREWEVMFSEAKRQGLQGFLWKAVSSLPASQQPPEHILDKWRKRAETIVILGDTHDSYCRDLTGWLDERGLRNCILKGQAFSRLYPEHGLRLCGDVDVWIPEPRRKILETFREGGFKFDEVLHKECKVDFFPGVVLDVHFQPSRMFNPLLDRRLSRFCRQEAERGFDRTDRGFNVPSLFFSAVYCVVHIFHHVVDGGAGLRQMMDLYYILQELPSDERGKVAEELRSLGLITFAGAAMYVLRNAFELDEQYLICPVNRSRGEALLRDIWKKGRVAAHSASRNRFLGFLKRTSTTMQFSYSYPREVLWAPVYKVWHFCWRGVRGYL